MRSRLDISGVVGRRTTHNYTRVSGISSFGNGRSPQWILCSWPRNYAGFHTADCARKMPDFLDITGFDDFHDFQLDFPDCRDFRIFGDFSPFLGRRPSGGDRWKCEPADSLNRDSRLQMAKI